MNSQELVPAVEGCVEACRRCRRLVGDVADDYPVIGPHMRHCLEHFTCLLEGLDSGVVDYDGRERDARLEQAPERFLAALDAVIARLSTIAAAELQTPLAVAQEVSPSATPVRVESNLERELVFLSGHTIHHLAIMKLLAENRGLRVSSDVDVAYSTASHLKRARSSVGPTSP